MGKASSAKKVARAARTGGSRKRERPKLAFPLAVFVVMVAGALLVVSARATHQSSADASVAPVANKDHWHAAYGLYVCDHFLPPQKDAKADDKLGIHTHGEGIIHIHPFIGTASGPRAQLKLFADQVGMTLFDDGFKIADGTEYRNGFDCKGKPGKFAVYKWKVDDPTAPIEVFEKDINKINFNEDRDAYTLAILPEGKEPPPQPDSVPQLDKLSDTGTQSSGAGVPGVPGAAGAGIPTPGNPAGVSQIPVNPVPGAVTPGAVTPAVPTPAPSSPAPPTLK